MRSLRPPSARNMKGNGVVFARFAHILEILDSTPIQFNNFSNSLNLSSKFSCFCIFYFFAIGHFQLRFAATDTTALYGGIFTLWASELFYRSSPVKALQLQVQF